jgi:NhaP-type Na+/H+ or K+/H+ antiporter
MHVPTLVAALAIVVVASAIFGYIAQRIGLVSIVGYIVAGIVVGPYVLGFIADDFELEVEFSKSATKNNDTLISCTIPMLLANYFGLKNRLRICLF